MTALGGIHHVTAICGDAQRNAAFYAGVLGLRLVKKTVNFDDPGSYHLYYGDRIGSPGTLVTFFAWPDAPRGQAGSGEPVALAFEVPAGSLEWWKDRLANADVATTTTTAFGVDVLVFRDPDGMRVELVESAGDRPNEYWEGGGIPEAHAVKGIYSVTLALRDQGVSAALYTQELGFQDDGSEDKRHRFAVGQAPSTGLVDVHPPTAGTRGRMGAGSIHHVAFRTGDDASQQDWLKKLTQLGLHVSPVMDRKYFHSIYFRELGGVLFEIATDGPGMTVDETEEQLGKHLALPVDYESFRSRLESSLPPIQLPSSLTAGVSAP